MTVSGFVQQVYRYSIMNGLVHGNHRRPDGTFGTNNAKFLLCWSAYPKQFELSDPTYFDQAPYDESGIRVDGRLVVNPVLHMKLQGDVTCSYSEMTESYSGWDTIHKTQGGTTEQILIGPGASGSFTYTNVADNAASGFANETEITVLWRGINYPLANGFNYCVVRFAELMRSINFGPQKGKGIVQYRLTAKGILWKGDRLKGVGNYKTSTGATRGCGTSSVVPSTSGTRDNQYATTVDYYYGVYSGYAEAYLSEVLPVSSVTGTVVDVDYTDVSDSSSRALAWASGLNPLNFLYGEIWRGLYSLNEMSADALASLPSFEGNGAMLAKELPGLAKLCFAISEGIGRLCVRLVAGGRRQYAQRSASLLAQTYLSDHYGLRLTLLDLKEVIEAELRGSTRRKHLASERAGSSRNGNWVARYTIYYTDMTILDLSEALKRLDIELDASNVWDSVPWSFVVDWFYNLGDFFQKCDNYYTLRKEFHCLGTVDSLKITRAIQETEYSAPPGTRADLHFSYYRRRVGRLPAIPLSNETTNPSLTHLVEGAALVVANLP